MIEMLLHGMDWCPHGHPIAVLRNAAGSRYVSLAISSEEGRALSPAHGQTPTQVRLCELIQALLGGLEARLSRVTLSVTANNVLAANLQIESPRVGLEVQVQATDGLILARLYDVPLRMAEHDLARVGHARPTQPHDGLPITPAPTAASVVDPLAPFRRALDDLDFGDSPRL